MKTDPNPFKIHFSSDVNKELKKKSEVRKSGVILRRKPVLDIDIKEDKENVGS